MPSYRPGFPLPFDELRDELDRVWNSLTSPRATTTADSPRASGAFPAVNVSESDDAITVEAELPGIDASALEITVHGDELTLAGPGAFDTTEQAAAAERPVMWHRRERGRGPFTRRIPLPVAVDPARIDARLVHGVLTVTCPKTPASQPHKIEVRTA